MSKLALVTGGTRGIGAAISKQLKQDGYQVAAVYASNDLAAEAFARETGIKVYKWDTGDYQSCVDGVARVVADFASDVSVLVNNAGITRDGMFHKSTLDQWQAVINTNLGSCYNMARSVINKMRDNNFGRIVSLSSINALSGQVGQVNYSASKAGIIGFTKALALESASKGITVNAIAPGYINTDMLSTLKPEVLNQIIEHIPLKHLGKTEDVARVVAFLVSDQASFITGETISVNGGAYMK